MVAGIPGAGIGGLFYLFAAFLMPIRALRREWRRERDGRVGEVMRQVLMATAILAGIWLMGWLIGLGLSKTGMFSPAGGVGPLRHLPGASSNIVRAAMVLGGFFTLGVVLLLAETSRFIFAPRSGAAPERHSGR